MARSKVFLLRIRRRPPEIPLPTLDVDEQFVQAPGVTQPSVRRTEGVTPLPNGLVGHGNTSLREEIFGIADAQTEPVVEADSMPDGNQYPW